MASALIAFNLDFSRGCGECAYGSAVQQGRRSCCLIVFVRGAMRFHTDGELVSSTLHLLSYQAPNVLKASVLLEGGSLVLTSYMLLLNTVHS